VETKTENIDIIILPGYKFVMKNREKNTKNRSGGIMVGFKDNLAKRIDLEWHFQIIQYVCKIVNKVSNIIINMSVFDQINKISVFDFDILESSKFFSDVHAPLNILLSVNLNNNDSNSNTVRKINHTVNFILFIHNFLITLFIIDHNFL
jgi:hypothetical protein